MQVVSRAVDTDDPGGSTAWVLPLTGDRTGGVADVGNKAYNLAVLAAAGLNVPGGFCVTTAAFRDWLDQAEAATQLRQRLEVLGSDQTGELIELAADLRRVLDALPLPAAVQAALAAAAARFDPQTAWAVRSSAIAEDLPGSSFAGQHDSFLNVRGTDALRDAVRRCWISIFSARAVCYRQKHRGSHAVAAMAVVVQEMVPAEAAGVLFTVDPLSGDPGRVVVEAVYGLGEALVSGQASPDRFVLDKNTGRISERTLSRKTVAVAAAAAGGVHQVPVPGEIREKPCLEDPVIERLGALAKEIENRFGAPQDIEWALGDGEIFLLQSRPITTVKRSGAAPPDIWTRANVMEIFPEVVTPMSWSLMERLQTDFLLPLLRRVGLDLAGRPLIGLVAGRAYLNLRGVADLVEAVSAPITVDFTAAFGGQHAGVEPLLRADPQSNRRLWALKNLGRTLRLALWLARGLPRIDQKIERWGERARGPLARQDPAQLSDDQLAGHAPAMLAAAAADDQGTWAAAVWMAAAAVGGSYTLFRATRRWLGDADGQLANRLLAGATGMNSAENGLELVRLAAWARQDPTLAQALLGGGTVTDTWARLPPGPVGQEFRERWQRFLEHHGHQARAGMDAYQPRWAEKPDFVLDMLRVYLRMDPASDPLATQARLRHERETLLTECRRRLRNPLKRAALGFLVRASQRGLRHRENMKNEGVRLVAAIRRTLIEAGKRLTARGILRDPADVFYLRPDELGPILQGRTPSAVLPLIAARQAERARLESLNPPSVVIGEFDPTAPAPPGDVNLRTFTGLAVSPGVVTGKARVILHADTTARVQVGEILVAPYTDPGWTPYFLAAAGLVVDVGGQLSHGSVVAREYGLPAVVNVGSASQLIRTGQTVRVDGSRGTVTVLD